MIIESKELKAEFSLKGAELISLQDQTGAQYIWQGEDPYWPGKAPLMFPICGFLKENYYYYKKEQYFMGVHGFAANSEFTLIDQQARSISFSLKANNRTKQHYPFDFELIVKYSLSENSLTAEFSVTNNGAAPLLYSLGWHPGLCLNWTQDDSIDNYYLAFSSEETLKRRPVTPEGLLAGDLQEMVINENKTLSLNQDTFKQQAIVLEDYPHDKVSLRHIHSSKSIDMTFDGFPHLTLWGQPGADFICLEPWQGLGDFVDHNNNFKDKKGILKLSGGSSRSCEISLKVNTS